MRCGAGVCSLLSFFLAAACCCCRCSARPVAVAAAASFLLPLPCWSARRKGSSFEARWGRGLLAARMHLKGACAGRLPTPPRTPLTPSPLNPSAGHGGAGCGPHQWRGLRVPVGARRQAAGRGGHGMLGFPGWFSGWLWRRGTWGVGRHGRLRLGEPGQRLRRRLLLRGRAGRMHERCRSAGPSAARPRAHVPLDPPPAPRSAG